ncbi:hypothetical protein BC567DRAFT_9810 [Phyllosticta citribraziliensis]
MSRVSRRVVLRACVGRFLKSTNMAFQLSKDFSLSRPEQIETRRRRNWSLYQTRTKPSSPSQLPSSSSGERRSTHSKSTPHPTPHPPPRIQKHTTSNLHSPHSPNSLSRHQTRHSSLQNFSHPWQSWQRPETKGNSRAVSHSAPRPVFRMAATMVLWLDGWQKGRRVAWVLVPVCRVPAPLFGGVWRVTEEGGLAVAGLVACGNACFVGD